MISFRAKPEDIFPEDGPPQRDWPSPGFGLGGGAAVGALHGVLYGATTGNIGGAIFVVAVWAVLGFLVGCGWSLWDKLRTRSRN